MRGEFTIRSAEFEPLEVARSPRRRMAFKGSFETTTDKGQVAVKNLSCTGAMLEGCDLPPAGREILLRAAGLELFGTIVWCAEERCGVHFDKPLKPAEVLELHRITPEQVRSEELNAAAAWFKSLQRID
jgi:hypothetical protein